MAPTPRPESRPPDRAVPVEASKFTLYPEVDFSQFLIAPGPGVESEVSGSHVAYLFQHNSRARPEGWFISHRVYYWPEREHHLELVIEDPRRRLGDEWFQDPPPRPERSPDRSNPTTPPQAPRDLSETPSAPTTQRIRRTAAATQYLAQTSTPTVVTTSTMTTSSKIVLKGLEPPRYDGKSVQGCRQFLTAVQTYNKMASITKVDEMILMALGRLDGVAADWAEPCRANFIKDAADPNSGYDSNFWFGTWKEFADTFISAFGLKQDKEDAVFKLDKLVARDHLRRNIRPVRLYTQDFNLLAGRTKLSQESQADKYYGGLPDRTKRVLINRGTDKTSLSKLQAAAAEIDEEWSREFGLPQLKNQRQTVQATVTSAPVSEVVAANNSRTPGPGNVCFQCGEAGHFARDHMPDGTIRQFRPRPRPQQVAAAVTPNAPSTSNTTLETLTKHIESLSANLTVLASEVQSLKNARTKEDF